MRNKLLLQLNFIAILVLIVASSVNAGDLYPPNWRGEQRTIFANWDTWDNFSTSVPMPADIWAKGTGEIAIVPPSPEVFFDPAHFAQVLILYEGKDDVLQVNDAYIGLALPNFYDEDNKTIRVQITYWTGNGNSMQPDFFVNAGPDPYAMGQSLPGFPTFVSGDYV